MQQLYYFNADGYATTSSVFEPGATPVAPPQNIPLGKVAQWDGDSWELVDEPVGGSGSTGGGAGGADRELLTTLYRVTQNFTGAVVGNVISATRMLDVSGSNAVQIGTTSWFNESTAAVLAGAPAAANIELIGTPGLTDAQLRASPISTDAGGTVVNVSAQPAAALGSHTVAKFNSRGALVVTLTDNNTNEPTFQGGHVDNTITTSPAMPVHGRNMVYNPANDGWDRMRGNLNGAWMQGNVAHNAVDAGNPTKIGGKGLDNANVPPGVVSGNRVDAWFDIYGSQAVFLSDGSNQRPTWTSPAFGDGVSHMNITGLPVNSRAMLMDPATGWFYRQRGNADGAFAQGSVASGSADSGNPLKIGGRVVNSIPGAVLAVGQRSDAIMLRNGALVTTLTDYNGNSVNLGGFAVDGDYQGAAMVLVKSANYVYNPAANAGTGGMDRMRGDTQGAWMQGNVAHGVADSGNPLKVGGVALNAPVAVAVGSRVAAWYTTRGAQNVALADTSGFQLSFKQPSIDTMPQDSALPVMNYPMVYNPTGDVWARMRGDVNGLWVNPAHETYSAVQITEVATSATDGSVYAAFTAYACTGLDIVNNTDADIEYQRNATGAAMTIKAGATRFIQGITNASQIAVRRKDLAATTVTVEAEAFRP